MKCPDCQNGYYLGAGFEPPKKCETCGGTNEIPSDADIRKRTNFGYPTGLKMPEPEREVPAPSPETAEALADRVQQILQNRLLHPHVPGDALPIDDSEHDKMGGTFVVSIEPTAASFFRPKGIRLFAPTQYWRIDKILIGHHPQISDPVDASYFSCLFGAVPVKWGAFSGWRSCYPLEITYTKLSFGAEGLRGYIVGDNISIPPAQGCGIP